MEENISRTCSLIVDLRGVACAGERAGQGSIHRCKHRRKSPHQFLEHLRQQRLRAVRQGFFRARMHLHQKPVRAGSSRREAHGDDEFSVFPLRGMGRP